MLLRVIVDHPMKWFQYCAEIAEVRRKKRNCTFLEPASRVHNFSFHLQFVMMFGI
jgi:hypothetical protein